MPIWRGCVNNETGGGRQEGDKKRMSERNVHEVTNRDPSLLTQFMAYCPYVPEVVLRRKRMNWNELTIRARRAYRDGYYREAEELHEMALAISRRGGRPDGVWAAETLHYLGVISNQCGEYHKAEERLQGALFIFEQCRHFKYRGPNLALTLCELGQLYINQNAYGRAEAMLNRAQLYLGEPDSADGWHIETIINLAHVRRMQHRLDEAESLYARLRELVRKEYGPDHPALGAYHVGMCYLHAARERYEDAECAAMKALCVYRSAMRPGHPNTAMAYLAWANVHLQQGRHAAAEPLIRRAILMRENRFGVDSPLLAQPLEMLITALRQRGDADAATVAEARLARIKELTANR
jgi:tetratricopeptide (TPR) repeat protein